MSDAPMKDRESPRVSVVIPSRAGVPTAVLESVHAQTFLDFELIEVVGVSPAGRARNEGARKARGEILVFLDDDAKMGHPDVLKGVLGVFDHAPDVGVVGVPRVLPNEANWFQRRIATEKPRIVWPVRDDLTPTEFEMDATCWAIKKQLFCQVGGFDESLVAGEDPEFLYRLNRLRRHRNCIAPNVWVYHPPPGNLAWLITKSFWYGQEDYQVRQLHPEWDLGPRPNGLLSVSAYLLLRTAWLLPHIFIPMSYTNANYRSRITFQLGFRPLKALPSYAGLWGYAYAWAKHL